MMVYLKFPKYLSKSTVPCESKGEYLGVGAEVAEEDREDKHVGGPSGQVRHGTAYFKENETADLFFVTERRSTDFSDVVRTSVT